MITLTRNIFFEVCSLCNVTTQQQVLLTPVYLELSSASSSCKVQDFLN